jgi:hypothetical protein
MPVVASRVVQSQPQHQQPRATNNACFQTGVTSTSASFHREVTLASRTFRHSMAPLIKLFLSVYNGVHRQAFSFSLYNGVIVKCSISAYNGIIVKLKRSISAYDFFFKNITI